MAWKLFLSLENRSDIQAVQLATSQWMDFSKPDNSALLETIENVN